MTTSIVRFTDDHLEAAAVLLTARHRADRLATPELPPKFEQPAEAATVLRELLATDGMRGVVAVDVGKPVGFVLGAPEFLAPTEAFAGWTRPRSVSVPYAGHATARHSLYPRLYAALAGHWVSEGFTAQYVTVPADRDAEETWFNLGFGRCAALAVRDTRPLDARLSDVPNGLAIRRAEEADQEAVGELPTALIRFWAEPPAFVPFLPESVAAQRQLGLELLADPACHAWLAFREGRLAAIQLFLAPESPHWFVAPIETPERSIYLFMVYTFPDERGAGVATALLGHTLAWAREAGYERCLLHYMTATRANEFWRGHGFRPTHHWLCCGIDERAIWAHGRA